MQDFLKLVERGYDLQGHSTDFIHELMRGHNEHQGRNKGNEELLKFGMYGQEPEYAFVGDTTTPATSIFRSRPGLIFNSSCSGGVVIPYMDSKEVLRNPRTSQAAMHFAAGHLNSIHNFRTLSSSNSSILPFILGIKPLTGPFMRNWKPYWDPIVNHLMERPSFQNADVTEQFRMLGIELAQRNANLLETTLRQDQLIVERHPNLRVIPTYYDHRDGEVITYERKNPESAYEFQSKLPYISIGAQSREAPHAFGCSCCDSRALHTHIYCVNPGSHHELYAIAAIVPDYHDVLQRGTPSSAWLQIEAAKASGCSNFVITGHTKCGGIDALVTWCKTGEKPADPYVAAWIKQAKHVVDNVLRFAQKNGFGDDHEKICRLSEMYVTQWSATNIKRYVGKNAQVVANYLDVVTRNVYPLPLIDTSISPERNIQRTYKMLQDYESKQLMDLSSFYDIPAKPERARALLYLEQSSRPTPPQ